MSDARREFLFTYRFDGAEWGVSIFAKDAAEAREKIKAVALARYDGELHMRIPAALGAFGLVPRIICWLRNRRWLGVH
jgi:hypothetical protein